MGWAGWAWAAVLPALLMFWPDGSTNDDHDLDFPCFTTLLPFIF